MRRITKKASGASGWFGFGLGLLLVGVTILACAESKSVQAGQQTLRPRRDSLTPAEERKANAGKAERGRRINEGMAPSAQDREYLRLVPQGVAFPRALIKVFRDLELSEEQRTRLENLARRSGNQMPALNRLRKAQSELLDEALYGETFEPATIEQRAGDLAATQAEIIKLQARLMTQIRQILKPEQGLKFRLLLMRERDRLIEEQRLQDGAPQGPPPQNPNPDQS